MEHAYYQPKAYAGFYADEPDDAEPLRLMEANYFRQTEEGREIAHRFWFGVHMKDGKAIFYPMEDPEKASFYIRNTAYHSGNEFATLTRNIVEFYKDRHNG